MRYKIANVDGVPQLQGGDEPKPTSPSGPVYAETGTTTLPRSTRTRDESWGKLLEEAEFQLGDLDQEIGDIQDRWEMSTDPNEKAELKAQRDALILKKRQVMADIATMGGRRESGNEAIVELRQRYGAK